MNKAERIRRKLAHAERLTREAYELARDVDGVLRGDLAGAVDCAARAGEHFAQYENRVRAAAESAAREQRELEEWGRCVKCDTGASASHVHCPDCGWAVGEFGRHAGQCQNRACGSYERAVQGVRYSDKAEPTFIERFGSTDAGFEERILDAEIAAAEGRPDREE